MKKLSTKHPQVDNVSTKCYVFPPQATTRRLSILFIANLALADTVLPLVTSLSTPVLVTIHGGEEGDHHTRSLTCRAVQGVMSTIMAVAVVSLGEHITSL